MPIEFVDGDLFADAFSVQAFAHGCNCQGSMGAGIAKGFRERYPTMAEQFRTRCKAKPREFNLGDVWLWKSEDRPWVFNLGTQEQIWHARASYEAIETALITMQHIADTEAIKSIAMPRIGVGYGGLSWKKVRAIVVKIFEAWPGRLIVYENYVPLTEASTETAETAPATPRKTRTRQKPVEKRGTVQSPFRLQAITISCTDIERTSRFYEKVLGATIVPTDNGIGHEYQLGPVHFRLIQNASKSSPAKFPTHAMSMLWLEVSDLSIAAELFATHNVKILDKGDGQFLMIADPDGLVIEVWESEPFS